MLEIKKSLLQREEQTNSIKISAKSDIKYWRNCCCKILCILLFLPIYGIMDEVNEENWSNVLININLCQYLANMHKTSCYFDFTELGLKLCQCVPMA